MVAHEELIESLRGLGFHQVEGKGAGVLEKFVTKRGEDQKLVALVSARDASMLVKHNPKYPPFKFHFKRDYEGALGFISDYVNGCSTK